jgi:hypothetical protein
MESPEMIGIVEILLTTVAVTAILALVMASMGLGVLLGRNPLQCGCRRLADGDAAAIRCEGCPHRSSTVDTRPAEVRERSGLAAQE